MVSQCKKKKGTLKAVMTTTYNEFNSLSTHSILNSNTSATNNIQLKENTHIYIPEQ